MSTNTNRSPDELKASEAFHALAQQRLEEFKRSGKSVPWAAMREYMRDKAAGRPATRPQAHFAGTLQAEGDTEEPKEGAAACGLNAR